ncbi:hypothetical protein [Nocardia arthritidis]|uniref:DUF3168 domain-containing protein n=1 Tax=Nocardia arthritidis TaxID=228602 RepID=A0A6G9YTQ0_9NOCA|nr:hypothetical protein [Nocardia arthritidis]QIS16497.1 hypothetical protein F5544_43465 [Nocardia arthritidis]
MLLGSKRHPAVSVIVTYLAPKISVPIMNHAPANRPDSFVRVTRVGGVKKNIVTDGPMLTFECWHPVSAEALSMQILDLLENAPGEAVDYLGDDGKPHKAWLAFYEEVGAPTQHPDPEVPQTDRWVLTARLGISTNL